MEGLEAPGGVRSVQGQGLRENCQLRKGWGLGEENRGTLLLTRLRALQFSQMPRIESCSSTAPPVPSSPTARELRALPMPLPWCLFPLAPVLQGLIQAPTPLVSWTISTAPAPCFLPLSFKSVLKPYISTTCPELDASQQPSTAPRCARASARRPTLSPVELGRCLSSAACTLCLVKAGDWLSSRHSRSFLPVAHAVPTAWNALPVTSTGSNATLNIHSQAHMLPCYHETFRDPFNQI